jgi:hypothetical protein
MSGEWIKMRHDLHEDPAVISIAGKLDIREAEVVGHLHWLWSWADKHSVDGNAVSVTADWIDRKIGRTGFASAMVEVRWLLIDGGTVTFPNFDRHNGETAKKRAVTNKRVSDYREVKRISNAECNDLSVTHVTLDALHKALPEEEEEEEEEEKKDQKIFSEPQQVPTSRFDEFWKLYPEKVGKKPCATKWKARQLDRVAEVIIADVRQRIATDRRWRDGFVPNPETYLNQDRWNDGIQSKTSNVSATTSVGNGAPAADDLDFLLRTAI